MRERKLTSTLLAENVRADRVIKAKGQEGVFRIRRGFFYRHGCDEGIVAQRLAEEFKRRWGLDIKVLEKRENWQPWPRDSYWEVTFRVPSQRVLVDDRNIILKWL
jgi:hypothetical protein